jgi:geranylgeranyl diphosphate synthase type II
MAHDEAAVFLAEAREIVEAALDHWLPPTTGAAPRLAEAMRYSVQAGGKRLRPALALAACRAVEGEDALVLPFACAVELVHTYSLIHDDLPAMDDDDLRRGRPTNHKVFGEALAILAGDALHTLAFEIVLTHTDDAALACALGGELAHAAGFGGMVGGQADDMAGDGAVPDVARLQAIHERKTAALIRACARGGAMAGGASATEVEALGRYGEALGLAFQITDDVLDVTGTATSLGKTPGKDAYAGKLTYVALEGLEAARARADAEIARALDALHALRHPELLLALAELVGNRDH